MFPRSAPHTLSCVSNDTEWMLKQPDFEVKLKMDGRQRRFADEANSIDNADPERKGALFPATCTGTALPFSSGDCNFAEERGGRQPTLDMFAFGSAVRQLVNPCPLDTGTQSLLISAKPEETAVARPVFFFGCLSLPTRPRTRARETTRTEQKVIRAMLMYGRVEEEESINDHL